MYKKFLQASLSLCMSLNIQFMVEDVHMMSVSKDTSSSVIRAVKQLMYRGEHEKCQVCQDMEQLIGV